MPTAPRVEIRPRMKHLSPDCRRIEITYEVSMTFEVENLGVSEVPTDIGCLFRTTVRGVGVHSRV